MALVAVAAYASSAYPSVSADRDKFVAALKDMHDWTIQLEYRGELIDSDLFFYKYLRCSLVHEGELPPDVRIDSTFADPESFALRAGGEPDLVVLVSPAWFHFFVNGLRAMLDARA